MKYRQSIKPISYLKAHAAELVREVADGGDPLIITQNGEAKVIIQDLYAYEQTQESLALLKMLAQSQKGKSEGHYTTARKAFREIRRNIKD